MKFGYARVSTKDQNVDMQLDALNKYGVDRVFTETASGRRADRTELSRLLDQLRNGDTLVIWKLDRLGRTVKQLISLAEDFEKNGISLVSLTENLDTTTPTGRFVFTIFCAAAQMERDVLVERTKEGLRAARARGRKGGKKPASPGKIENAIKLYNSEQFSIAQIKTMTGLSKSTIYKYLQLEKEKRNAE